MRVWLVVSLLSGVAVAQEDRGRRPEVEAHGPRLRTFIGGFSSGGFLLPTFHVGPVGVAADVGVQFNRKVSAYGALRASTAFQTNWVQLVPSFDCTWDFFSLGAGVGAALSLNFIPTQLGGIRPALVVPLTLGFSTNPVPDGARLGSVRFNLELAFVWNPTAPFGFGGTVGLSIGRQSR
ncbi:MAG: hypothetical protein DI536_00705 [Archangium gephyra]|uniref:Uncharacterized protein n=1 Tax=Archangium gephyra TaxID=48 RepID=A0A2W5VRY3_9BACT|nr:MAG: hypothetical protein DI536_00705 [Archangium gephyra]